MFAPSRHPNAPLSRRLLQACVAAAASAALASALAAPLEAQGSSGSATEALEKALAAARNTGGGTPLGGAPTAALTAEAYALLGQASGAEIEEQNARIKKFIGWDWDLGVAVAYDLEGERVDSARVVDGLVRVDNESRASPRIVATIHYFWPVCPKATPCAPPAATSGLVQPKPLPRFGTGPFVGIQSSKDDLIDAFVAGWMIGWPTADGERSFNVGLGISLDSKVKTLGEGITANMPLPGGETEVRFKTEDRMGAMLLFSFGW